jgi:hypothetical protein
MVGEGQLAHGSGGLDRLSDSIDFEKTADFYEAELKERIKGPQLEGLTIEWLYDALADERTRTLKIGGGVVWPVFVPVQHNHDYRKEFFDSHFPGRSAYYFSAPPDVELVQDEFAQHIETLRTEGAIIGYDILTQQGVDEVDIPEVFRADFARDVTPESDAYGMEYGQPMVSHFESVAKPNQPWPLGDGDTSAAFARLVERGEYEKFPTNGPAVLTKDDLINDKQLLEQIWNIYSEQFDELVDDHPSLQIQPREELERMLLDEESLNIAYIDEGRIAALVYFVSNMNKCVWLNPDFYEKLHKKSPETKLAYFPGIVVDASKARQSAGYADAIIRMVEAVSREAGVHGLHVVFQCTNVSETYIPKIVTSVLTNGGVVGFDRSIDEDGSAFSETARYCYKVIELAS